MATKKRKTRATRDEYKTAGIIGKVLDLDTIEEAVTEAALDYREEARGLEVRRKVVLSRQVLDGLGRHFARIVLDALQYMNDDE